MLNCRILNDGASLPTLLHWTLVVVQIMQHYGSEDIIQVHIFVSFVWKKKKKRLWSDIIAVWEYFLPLWFIDWHFVVYRLTQWEHENRSCRPKLARQSSALLFTSQVTHLDDENPAWCCVTFQRSKDIILLLWPPSQIPVVSLMVGPKESDLMS